MSPGKAGRRAGEASWSWSLQSKGFCRPGLPWEGPLRSEPGGGFPGKAAPAETSLWSPSPELVHPTPSCPPSHCENGVLLRPLASESGSLGSGISAPTLASCENFSKLLNFLEPWFHHPSNDLNNNSFVELLGGYKSEPPCIAVQVVHCTIPAVHH